MTRRTRGMVLGVVSVLLLVSVASSVVAPPPNTVVSGFLAVWLHGTGVQIEVPDRLDQILYRAFHTRIVGKANTENWLHFPLTTPVVGAYRSGGSGGSGFSEVVVNYRRYHLDRVFVSFRTGSIDARVTSVHVYDGAKRIAAFDHLNLYGEQRMRPFDLPDAPEVEQGICISLGVEFGLSGQRWIELQSVGADFFYQEN